jgi:uncharacterized membrane protein YhaH (DUF805 family)
MAVRWLDRVCCLELKTAVLIIGVFNLVAALFGVLGSGVGAAGTSVGLAAVNGAFGGNVTNWTAIFENPENLSPENRQELDKLRNLLGLQEGSNEDGIDADAINTILIFAIGMMVVLLVICILYVIVASLLIHGARKGKAGLLIPWIVLTVITFIYDCIKIIQVIYNYWDSPRYMGLVCGLIGCHMGIASYLIVIVYSFRLQLRRGDASASNEMRKM